MFTRIMLAVDGSEESQKAARLVRDLAVQGPGEVIVLHVRDLYYSGAAVWSPEWSQELEASLHRMVDDLRAKGVKARLDVQDAAHGQVAKAIVDAAAAEGADLIVVGSRGLSGLPAFLLGSVSSRVLHLATCPVLVVR
jgi:nucleotide-binding universal stress UspA family protein